MYSHFRHLRREDDNRSVPVAAIDGGYFVFKFKVPLTIVSIGLLNNQWGAEFEIEDIYEDKMTIEHKDRGQNSFEEVEIGFPVATKMKVKLYGPTAVTHITLTDAPFTC